jgi:hypothetical protein
MWQSIKCATNLHLCSRIEEVERNLEPLVIGSLRSRCEAPMSSLWSFSIGLEIFEEIIEKVNNCN